MDIQTVNPTTEEVLNNYTCLDFDSIDKKIAFGYEAYLNWKDSKFDIRRSLMLNLAQILKDKKQELAHLMALEMGKPITAGRAEIEKCAWVCEHYAENAEQYLMPRTVQTEMKTAKVCYRPLGIVFAIMPWNFPFWQVFRFSAPTIMAGNGAILKHAPISSGTGNKIEELFRDAGFPSSLFQHLIVDNDGASHIIENQFVTAVTLTGSERAGQSVAAHAGKNLKKSVLELGGSDPYLILEDADLDLAAQCIVASRLNNTGQVCIAAKRVIALQSIEKELISKIKELISKYKMGDPLDPNINLGPMARKDLRENLHSQVEKSVKQGAKLLLGGIIPEGKGYFYPPTLLTDVKPGMTAFDEELFGPVIVIITAKNESEAISLANMSQYGLGAAVFTKDLNKGEHIATYEIEAGACFVNAFVASDPRLPFGGIKRSGYGRELSREGILEFVNTKTIAISDPKHGKK
ncbi:TPA: NAD-dependent succinate-semialdehyde dehydrogenase [Legionella pneumophila]|nr:NAD-dependent succinate-semialdehyde dehydrogenase [Legionella pneumophila]